MEEIINNLKKNWVTLAKFGVFVSGIITILITSPPIEDFNNNLIRFLITIIIAFFLIPLFLFKQKVHFKYWLTSALITFVLTILLLTTYNILLSKYVVSYDNTKVVIGSKFSDTGMLKIKKFDKEDNEIYEDGSVFHKKTLLSYTGGNAEAIWDSDSIYNKKVLLVLMFYLSISSITILLLCLIQTLQILFSK